MWATRLEAGAPAGSTNGACSVPFRVTWTSNPVMAEPLSAGTFQLAVTWALPPTSLVFEGARATVS